MDDSFVEAVVQAVSGPEFLSGNNNEHQYAVIPERMKVVDLKPFIGPPSRIKQNVEMLSVEAFCDYLARYSGPDTVIFANEAAAQYEAVIDYHKAPIVDSTLSEDVEARSARGNQDHRMMYRCPQSEQWMAWVLASNKLIEQETFAQFIEANLSDIKKPSGADMLQICLQLQVHKKAAFESGIRLDNGQVQFRYSEEIRGTANTKAGDLAIPADFLLNLPVFVDGKRFEQAARFKYRMEGGKLSLGYELIRPQETFRQAVKQVTTQIREGAAGLPLYQGTRA